MIIHKMAKTFLDVRLYEKALSQEYVRPKWAARVDRRIKPSFCLQILSMHTQRPPWKEELQTGAGQMEDELKGLLGLSEKYICS